MSSCKAQQQCGKALATSVVSAVGNIQQVHVLTQKPQYVYFSAADAMWSACSP
jgi:hypothetical protein